MTTGITSPRLRELLRMRRFIDEEIAAERQRIAFSDVAGRVQAAADLYGTTVDDIQSGNAYKARMLACWLLRESGLSYPDIGKRLNCHHTTVMHACRTIEADSGRLALGRGLLEQEAAA